MNHGQTSQVTRRKFLTSASIGAGPLWLAPPILFAQNGNPVTASRNEGAAAKIIVQHLRDGISVLSGSGGNIAVLSGADGKILVDAGLTTSRRGIAEALGGLDANPVRHLINTHWHYDHTDGNEWLNSAGARIIAQENTRNHLSTASRPKVERAFATASTWVAPSAISSGYSSSLEREAAVRTVPWAMPPS